MPVVSNGAVTPLNAKYDAEEAAALEEWIRLGGRGLDSAWNYNLQGGVGWAIGNTSEAVRAELFVTTKIPCVGSASAALAYIEADLRQLQVASVDLLLIHSPGYGTAPVGQPAGCWGHTPCCANAAELQATWAGLEAAHTKGLVKAIGLSNCRVEHINAVAAAAKVLPAVNQCQMFVGRHDDPTIARCRELGIVYEAYSPLGPWDQPKPVLSDKTVATVATAHNVSAAVVGMRWIAQQNLTIVTAVNSTKFDTEDIRTVLTMDALTAAEMKALSAVSYHPAAV